MKSKHLIVLMALLIGINMAKAERIIAEQALTQAQQFAKVKGHRAPGKSNMTLAYQTQDYYVFNYSDGGGFVIVSGDDRTTPILGYSDNGAFDYATLPDNMRWWLGQYRQEIEYLQSHPEVPMRKASKLNHSVPPMLTCLWNQTAPYNNLCPTYTADGETKRAVTGCVATAMAQIMFYHRWPVQGTGSHDYYYEVGGGSTQRLSADFSKSFYDWAHMLDDYDNNSDETSQTAVAKLMSDVGIAMDMQYDDGSSGAYSQYVPDALINYFKYDRDTRYVPRRYYGIEGWEQMLRDEIDGSRPVYYSGSSGQGGHAFVVDGYDTDGYFHINWGWGGRSNGYFLISMLNPHDQGVGSFEGGYNNNQAAIVGIQPQRGEADPYAFNAFYNGYTPNETSVNLGDTASIDVPRAALLGNKNWTTLEWGTIILNESEKQVAQEPTFDTDASDIDVWKYYSATMKYVPATTLADGVYHVRMVYRADGKEYKYFTASHQAPLFIEMRVNAGVAYFSIVNSTGLQLLDMTTNSDTLLTNKTFEIKADVKNTGLEYYDNVYFALLQNGQQKAKSSNVLLDLSQGKSFSIVTQMNAPPAQGIYQLAMFDTNDQQVGNQLTVTVQPSGSPVLELASDLKPASETMPSDNIQATIALKNTGDKFMGVIEMFILPLEELKIKSIQRSQVVTIGSGETVEVSFRASFGGVVGKQYRLWMRDPNRSDANYLWGDPVVITIGEYRLTLPGDVNGDGIVDVADVNAIINFILGRPTEEDLPQLHDLNEDGTVDIADINQIVNIILSK